MEKESIMETSQLMKMFEIVKTSSNPKMSNG